MFTIEDAMNHHLWEEQVALEQEMRSLGIETQQKIAREARDREQFTRTGPVARLLSDSHPKMVAAIKSFYADVEAKAAGRRHTAYPYLHGLDLDVIAHLTIRIVLDMASWRRSFTHVAVVLSDALEDECNFRFYKEQHPAGYFKSAARARRKSNARYKRQSVLQSAKTHGVQMVDWPKKAKIFVGTKLVELFIEATNLAIIVPPARVKAPMTVALTDQAQEWIVRESKNCELLTPTFLPTVIPPRPWTSPYEGGYWTGRSRRLTLVKNASRSYLEELAGHEMPEVYGAVNALQATSWRINSRILDVMETMWSEGSQLGLVPLADRRDDPPRPHWLSREMTKETMTPDQLDEFKRWKGECVKVYDENGQMQSKRIAFLKMMWVARKFQDREFYFPYNLDWRGRAYPVSLYLHPQGNDAARALLEFGDLCPIQDQEAADWLAIYGASLWGVDKVSLEERIEWVAKNTPAILASARDPYANRFWQEAEKPWQALAFCIDWSGFQAEGFGYLSALPIAMDGSCNGLQNFSAMLRDERGGKAVNLVPSDRPQDIYSEVSEIVRARVTADLSSDAIIHRTDKCDILTREIAALWVGRVDRKVVKRPVMTLPYGAKKYGFTDMVLDDTVKEILKTKPKAFGPFHFEAATYMAGLIWDAVQEVVEAAVTVMAWLQEVAQIVSCLGLPIYWRSPTGLLVRQAYHVRKMVDVKLMLKRTRIRLKIDKGSDRIDSRKQALGIAPNFVHSLDASHMCRTVCASAEAGIRSLSMIHDSFGTHAGNAGHLAAGLREQFVEMYSGECVLERFRTDLQAMLPEDVVLPPVPEKGDLDLLQILDSPFFFA